MMDDHTEAERAWLIERKASRFGPAAWWAGCGPLFDIDNERCWTKNAHMAIKFVDAQSGRHALWTLLRMAHQTARDNRVEVTEHMWPAAARAQASAPADAPTTADTWPIAKLTVDDSGLIQRAGLYAPGLPPGDHDVWPCPVALDAEAVAERAAELHDKASMPLAQALELAMSEAGVAPPAQQWLPIETAPKVAGAQILTWRVDGWRGAAWWQTSFWADERRCWVGWPMERQPTHWMPLPPAPQHQGGGK